MMLDNEADLNLSLSLNLTHINTQKLHQKQHQPFPNNNHNANLFPSLFNSSFPHRASFNPFLPGVDQTLMMHYKDIDVNRQPTHDDANPSSPNSTISILSGKRTERDDHNDVTDHLDRAVCSGSDDELDGDNSRKKLRLSKDQSDVLEETFKDHNTLNPKQKTVLAKQLGLRPRQVEVWFQNRRARMKLKQTEVDCDFLKRCCENLTEENRRLQKEVQELRALKLSPNFYMQMAPPTTLNMCPSCERVGPSTRMA